MMLVTYDRAVHVRETFTTDRDRIAESTFELENLSELRGREADQPRQHPERDQGHHQGRAASRSSKPRATPKAPTTTSSSRCAGSTRRSSCWPASPAAKPWSTSATASRCGPARIMFQLVVSRNIRTAASAPSINLQANRYNARRLFQQLIGRANASGMTFYTIDAAGLKAGGTDADRGGGGSTFEVDVTYQLNRQEPLLLLADETGGLASIGTSNFGRAFQNINAGLHPLLLAGLPAEPQRRRAPARHRGQGHPQGRQAALPRRLPRQEQRDPDRRNRHRRPALRHRRQPDGHRRQGARPGRRRRRRPPPAGRGAHPARQDHPGAARRDRSSAGCGWRSRCSTRTAANRRSTRSEVPIEIPAKDLEVALTKYFVYAAQLRIGKGSQRMVVTVRDEFAGLESTVRKSLVFGP